MPRPRTYQRVEHQGVEYYQLYSDGVIVKIDTKLVQSVGVPRIIKEYRQCVEAVKKVFELQTGHPLVTIEHQTGFTWAVEISPSTCQNYRWMQKKVEKFAKDIVKHLNRIMKTWKGELDNADSNNQ